MSDHATRLEASSRLQLAPAATRIVGEELLVNVGGATAPVRRLGGIAPYLWEQFAAGHTIQEVVRSLERSTDATAERIEQIVVDFAAQLVDADLAEPATS